MTLEKVNEHLIYDSQCCLKDGCVGVDMEPAMTC